MQPYKLKPANLNLEDIQSNCYPSPKSCKPNEQKLRSKKQNEKEDKR